MNLLAVNLFDKNTEQLNVKSRIEVAKFEPEPTFENTINDIKANYLKSITSITINVPDITSNKPSSSSEHIKSYLVPWILLLSPVKSPQFTKHLSSVHPKGNIQLQIKNCGFLLDQNYIYHLFGQTFFNTSQ